MVSKISLGYEEALQLKTLEISHARQSLTNDHHILVFLNYLITTVRIENLLVDSLFFIKYGTPSLHTQCASIRGFFSAYIAAW